MPIFRLAKVFAGVVGSPYFDSVKVPGLRPLEPPGSPVRPPLSTLHLLSAVSSLWWAQVDSNHRPHAYQACALTT